ncbi:glutathione S-transferase [Stappia sp. F7233]|uniref:Glutathione S-transferase n=1 Tax=Stappia albiluteola TaxID=2758565 RepID=A0A839AC80_9HYPH|nr:glutathione S-transferase [Stappia albiluteola]MBA5776594.1 glutathione S-transferase [Stappia albiluteola]
MKLYDGGRAPNPRRVRIFLAEKGVSVPLVPVDIMAKDHKTDAFTRMNPMQRIPVLELDNGAVISESVAICRYFEELFPEPALMGSSPLEKATIEMWNRRVELGIFSAVAASFRHAHPAMRDLEVPQIGEWAQANREKAIEMMRFLDEELAGRDFVAGDSYSIADITLYCAIDFCRLPKIEMPEELHHLKDWYERMAARESAKA